MLRAESLVRHFHPKAVMPLGVAVRLLDGAALLQTGHRFHKLDVTRQQALLRGWTTNPVLRAPLHAYSTLLKFAHFDSKHVYESQGGQ